MIVKVNNVICLLFALILMLKCIETKSVNASSKIFSEENDEISREHDANSINKLLHYILNSGEKLTILEESNKHLTQEEKLKKLKSVLYQLVIFFDEIKNALKFNKKTPSYFPQKDLKHYKKPYK